MVMFNILGFLKQTIQTQQQCAHGTRQVGRAIFVRTHHQDGTVELEHGAQGGRYAPCRLVGQQGGHGQVKVRDEPRGGVVRGPLELVGVEAWRVSAVGEAAEGAKEDETEEADESDEAGE